MTVLIVEDEILAGTALARVLASRFPDLEVIGRCASIAETVEMLAGGQPDAIFMDVELSDGNCFEIFRRVDIRSKVVITTAYDSYAVKAFEAGSIDYLLKPIELPALTRAVERLRSWKGVAAPAARTFRKRYILTIGNQILPIDCDNISHIFSEDKANYIVTKAGARYLINGTMESIIGEIDPAEFFQISRGCIVSRSSVAGVTKLIGGRLRVDLTPRSSFDATVSRARVDAFLDWWRS